MNVGIWHLRIAATVESKLDRRAVDGFGYKVNKPGGIVKGQGI
jgi:hypothetical protein